MFMPLMVSADRVMAPVPKVMAEVTVGDGGRLAGLTRGDRRTRN
jgi:hypothetical protein